MARPSSSSSSSSHPPSPSGSKKALLFVVCLMIDVIGMFSYFFPMVGEVGDFVWAPVAAFLLQMMFGNMTATAAIAIEEILPGLDFIPTALLTWLYEFYIRRSPSSSSSSSSSRRDTPRPRRRSEDFSDDRSSPIIEEID